MKKGPLSNNEKEQIETLYKGSSPEELSAKMDRSVSIINKFIEKLPKQDKKPKKESRVSKLLARDENKTTVVMTEAASMESDTTPKKREQPARYRNVIHKIKDA